MVKIRGKLNRLKRLEKLVKEKAPKEMNAEQQKQFIAEKSEAVEMYLKATTKEEEQKATNLIDKVNAKYNHELPKGFYDRYSVEELQKLLKWVDEDDTKQIEEKGK